MGIKIGTTGIGAVMIGAAAMAKVYIGSTLVWTSVPPTPPPPPIPPQIVSEFVINKKVKRVLPSVYTEFQIIDDLREKL